MIYEKYRNTRIKEPLFLFNIEAEAFFLNISLISEYTDLLQRNGSLPFLSYNYQRVFCDERFIARINAGEVIK